jgi:hypothetical protein
MPWVDSLDWTSLNALRRYPLREGCSALSTDESFDIPDTFIVDFTLSATSAVERRFHISKIFNKLTAAIVEISDDLGNIAGTFEISAAAQNGNTDVDYYMNATDLYVGANGKMTVGTLSDLAYRPSGIFQFTLTATEFEPRTVIPGLRGVDRLVFIDSASGQYSLTGDVTITSRNNLRFSYATNKVILDAGDNLGLNKQCAISTCIKSINGVVPDPATGNVSLIGTNCLTVSSPSQYTLNLEDSCCTPCSGCNDLEELTTRLTSLENKFLDLRSSYSNVNNQLTTYLSTINSNCACPS